MTDSTIDELVAPPARMGRRKMIRQSLLAAAAIGTGIGYAVRDHSADFQGNIEDLVLRLRNTLKDSSSEYSRLFADYGQIISDARSFAQRAASEQKVTYATIEAVALMYQADLLSNKAGNNIVKGQEIRIGGLPAIKASSSTTDSFYNRLKALDNYEEVIQIHEEIEKAGNKLPENIGYGMGNYGKVAPRDLINLRMFETINKLLDPATPNLPKQYAEKLSMRGYELSSVANQPRAQ